MHDACAVCGLRYEREPGYFVGAIYVSYAVTVGIAIVTVLVADATIGLGLAAQLAIAVGLCVLLPLLFFRHARSLWLGIEYLVTSFDERRA